MNGIPLKIFIFVFEIFTFRWKINVIDKTRKDFIERLKKVMIKFKEAAQNEENDTCVAIITENTFMAQLFSYVTNSDNHPES